MYEDGFVKQEHRVSLDVLSSTETQEFHPVDNDLEGRQAAYLLLHPTSKTVGPHAPEAEFQETLSKS